MRLQKRADEPLLGRLGIFGSILPDDLGVEADLPGGFNLGLGLFNEVLARALVRDHASNTHKVQGEGLACLAKLIN